MWQEFFKPFDGVFRNTPEDIAEPGKRIDSCQFTRSNEAAEYRRSPTAVIASEEGPVVPFMCNRT
jgi:hypothetical protein